MDKKQRSLKDFIATCKAYDERYKQIAKASDHRLRMMTEIRSPRIPARYLEPTRENVLLCLTAIAEGLREQIADMAMECFAKAPRLNVIEEGGEEYFEMQGEDIFIQLDEFAIMRICNYSMNSLGIDISDRGTITRFKFKAPVLRVPLAIADHDFFDPFSMPKYALSKFQNPKEQRRFQAKYGDAGDRFNPLGLAWKYGDS